MENTNAVNDVLEQRKQKFITANTKIRLDHLDDFYLAIAAACFLNNALDNSDLDGSVAYRNTPAPDYWPLHKEHWKLESVRQDLIRSANLLIDEIESIDRMAEGA